jgi:signal transduction histidine kinase
MFKSFTHEIKTPLNGVISIIDLAKSMIRSYSESFKEANQEVKLLEDYILSIESGVVILKNNLNDLIVFLSYVKTNYL